MTLNTFLIVFIINSIIVLILAALMHYDRAQREQQNKSDK